MNAFHDFQHGRKIYANYEMLPPIEFTRYDIYDMLNIANMEMDISPKTLLIQEASKWFDSRRSSSKENVALTSLTGQSGKREIDILYDDQFASRIDKGLRDITDQTIVCHCERMQDGKTPFYFQYLLFDGFPTEHYFRYTGKQYMLPASFMQQFYSFYNTREPTKALIMRKHEMKADYEENKTHDMIKKVVELDEPNSKIEEVISEGSIPRLDLKQFKAKSVDKKGKKYY